MAPTVEMPTQIQPTVPAPPSGASGLTPREPAPVIGGPGGGPPRPPKRPTGGGGNGGGGNEPGGPGDDAARKRLTLIVAGVGILILVVMFVLLSSQNNNDGAAVTTPAGLPVATQSQAKAAAASLQTTPTATPAGAAGATTAAPASTPAATSTTPGDSSGGVAVGGDETTPAANVPLLQAGSVTKIKSKVGQTITFKVKSTTAQEVHVHGYDRKYDIAAGQTQTISFPATIGGIFDVEFENTGTQIGELTVEP